MVDGEGVGGGVGGTEVASWYDHQSAGGQIHPGGKSGGGSCITQGGIEWSKSGHDVGAEVVDGLFNDFTMT